MAQATSVQLVRRPFTTAEYHQMIEVGILGENDRVELLNGEIVPMSPIGKRHAACVDRVSEALYDRVRKIAIVRVQNPVELDNHSEPEPDISVLKRRADFYSESLPSPDDVFLAIEVADSSLEKDRLIKLPTYAQAGIGEVWLIDLPNDRIEVHSSPHNGIYQEVRIVQRGQKVISRAMPNLSIKADDLLI